MPKNLNVVSRTPVVAEKSKSPKTVSRVFKKTQRRSKTKSAHDEAVSRFAKVLMRVIRAKLSNTAFTRDDILALVSQMRLNSTETWATGAAGINDTATSTRYRKICDAVQVLLSTHQLAQLGWLRFCLPELQEQLGEETPPQVAYLPTIRRLVQQYADGSLVDAMAIVDKWRSDQHLPENVKRMTVRSVLPVLVRENVLKRGSYQGEFVVK